jgi:hypothetical protein
MKSVLRKLRGTYFIIFFCMTLIAIVVLTRKPSSVGAYVYDAVTKAPMQGVYMLAEYRKAGSDGVAHSASVCVDTKGMYTGPDGKFEFPIIDGMAPIIYGITEDYFDDVGKREITTKYELFGYRYVLSKDFAMARRQKGGYFDAAYVLCDQAWTSEAAKANREYLKIYKRAREKYVTPKASGVT